MVIMDTKKFIKLGKERVPIKNISGYKELGYVSSSDSYEIMISFYNKEEFFLLYDDEASYSESLLKLDRKLLLL